MAYLSYPSATEVQLRLDSHEGSILAVLRGCPWWLKADFEGRVPGSGTVTSVTLTATREMDSTLRRIVQMSSGLAFPKEGGLGLPVRELPPEAGGKRSSARKH
jgi:hypothetical protein